MEPILWCSIYSDMRFVDIPLFRVSHGVSRFLIQVLQQKQKTGSPVLSFFFVTDIEVGTAKIEFELTNETNYIFIVQKALNEYTDKLALDSEDTTLEEVTINGHTGFYKVKDGVHTLNFFDNNNYYKILGNNISKKEIIRIAESFEIVV